MNSKLILNKDTSLEDISRYFENIAPDKNVRARENKDGQIKLYVRKDSFKQFFTDKLKPDTLVRRDYLKAREHILDIVRNFGDHNTKAAALFTIRRLLDAHRHDFFVSGLNESIKDFQNTLKAIEDPQKAPKNI